MTPDGADGAQTESGTAGTVPVEPLVYRALLALMADVDAIGKNRRNEAKGQGGFMFRGIDDVMNALHEPLARNGLVCIPRVLDQKTDTRATGSGGTMNVTRLHVAFTFYATDGSSVGGSAWGEAHDSGDKSTGKAHSMALKTFLLETLCIPTEDQQDPDAESVAAAPETAAQRQLRERRSAESGQPEPAPEPEPSEADVATTEWLVKTIKDRLDENEQVYLRNWLKAENLSKKVWGRDESLRVTEEVSRLLRLRGESIRESEPAVTTEEAVANLQAGLGAQVIPEADDPGKVGPATF